MAYDVIVVGAGFAGSTLAQKFTADGKKVLVIESRAQIGGNMYDYIDENGVNRHEYGPHIFHTNSQKVVDYLSNFTEWYPYTHRVLGKVNGFTVPIPFNLKSIEESFDNDKANRLKEALVSSYGMDKKVPILELRKNSDPDVKELANYIYEYVFKYYTMKQWGLSPEEIDPNVTNRVPVNVSYDDRYFADKYQIMPKEGYTKIFEKMLDGVDVRLNTKANDVLTIDLEHNQILFENEVFNGPVIYTGAVDELLDYQLGELPYRSLRFDIETHDGQYQQAATVNYPTPHSKNAYTRITEYKLLMEDYPKDKTTIAIEYPLAYDRKAYEGNIPYYPIFTDSNWAKYEKYCKLIENIGNLYLVGRLAEYKYYNMDAIIEKALNLYESEFKK